MNRETRDKFASGTDQSDLTTGNACWQTAPLVFEKLNADFGPFDIDLTADAQRRLCKIWFGPDSPVGELDALSAHWLNYGLAGYSNPPYGPFVARMLAQAKASSIMSRFHAGWADFSTTLLLPMRVTRAFRDYVLDGASDLIFPDKRLVFFESGVPRINERLWREKGQARADCALFDSIIVRYRPGWHARPAISEWKVPVHVTPADLERAAELRRSQVAA